MVVLRPVFLCHQDMRTSFQSVLQREIKLHFLQLVAQGQVYPERSSSSSTPSPTPPSPSPTGTSAADPTSEDSVSAKHSKRFNVEELGLTWETVETVHWFMFPGEHMQSSVRVRKLLSA